MDRRIRYEVLQNEDPDEPVSSPDAAPEVAIPATVVMIEETTEQATGAAEGTAAPVPNAVEFKIPEPPSYATATALPTYEEAERSKLEQEEEAIRQQEEQAESPAPAAGRAPVDPLLGTDGIFLLTFMVSFIFNWIGLLASQCLSQSVAGRLGSMAGFGLSLVKWVAIFKHNNWIHGVADADSWLWWLLILLGFLIFFRGCTQYVRIKYQWGRLSQNVRNNIFYYF